MKNNYDGNIGIFNRKWCKKLSMECHGVYIGTKPKYVKKVRSCFLFSTAYYLTVKHILRNVSHDKPTEVRTIQVWGLG